MVGEGILTLTRVHTYTGPTHLHNGTVILGTGGSIETSSEVVLFQNYGYPIFNISAGNKKIKNLNGFADTKVILGARTLTIGTEGEEDGGGVFQGVISGEGGSIIKTGKLQLGLTGANIYTGKTTINEGYLFIGWATETGSLASTVIENNSWLGFARTNDYIYEGVISGTGSVITDRGGTITLNGVNTYTGETTINRNGSLVLGSSGSIEGSSSVKLSGGDGVKFDISAGDKKIKNLSGVTSSQVILGSRTLTIGTSGQNDGGGDYSGGISGTGGITKTGADNLTLSGANTATGALTLKQGKLTIANGWKGDFSKDPDTGLAIQGVVNIGGSFTLRAAIFIWI